MGHTAETGWGKGSLAARTLGRGLLRGGRSNHTRNAHPSLRYAARLGGPRSLSKQVCPKALEARPSELGGKLPAPPCSSSTSSGATRESSGPHSLKSRGHNGADTKEAEAVPWAEGVANVCWTETRGHGADTAKGPVFLRRPNHGCL